MLVRAIFSELEFLFITGGGFKIGWSARTSSSVETDDVLALLESALEFVWATLPSEEADACVEIVLSDDAEADAEEDAASVLGARNNVEIMIGKIKYFILFL